MNPYHFLYFRIFFITWRIYLFENLHNNTGTRFSIELLNFSAKIPAETRDIMELFNIKI